MDKQQLFQQITECPVCYLTFTEPKVLPCDHLLCKSCTDHIKKGSPIKCPVCNKLSPASDTSRLIRWKRICVRWRS